MCSTSLIFRRMCYLVHITTRIPRGVSPGKRGGREQDRDRHNDLALRAARASAPLTLPFPQ